MINAEKIAHDFCRKMIQSLDNLEFSIYVGGSLAIKQNDRFSDVDVCIVHNGNIDFSNIAGAENIRKTSRGFQADVFFAGEVIDLRLDRVDSIVECIGHYKSYKDLSPRTQLYLSALQAGQYYRDDVEVRKLTLNLVLDKEARGRVIEGNYRFIRDYGFAVYLERGDYATFVDMLLFSYRAFVHIFYALDFSLFRGYKHAPVFETERNEGGSAVLTAFQRVFKQPELIRLEELADLLKGFFQRHLPFKKIDFDIRTER
ncbi:nucleotidyltransferase domain-containing protein [Pseudomonas sp. UBT]|uniref:nucleotidyltransferase domain-containing protein n=1 Tax=Pseudomonas sp. UBT TaxID=3239198 RepID=UPI003D808DC0